MSRTLITGIAGSLAQLTGLRLKQRGDEVFGVDYRPRPRNFPSYLPYFQANYNKTRIEDAFRRFEPDTVLHLGRVGNLKMRENKRFDLNVIGSAKVRDLCLKYKVKRLVVLSTFHIYGAHPHNHIPIHEDEPLRAGQIFPQLADAVQLDNLAVQWIFRHQKLKTAVLRPVNIVGPHIMNSISRYLRQSRIPYIAGYSPMWQFIHEDDMVNALCLAQSSRKTGVFNVAGMGTVPLLDALEQTGASLIPVPSPFAKAYLGLRSAIKHSFPPYLIDFFKYHCVVDDTPFRKEFGYEAKVGIVESLRSTVENG